MLGNWLKTSILMAGIIALFGAIGMMLGGRDHRARGEDERAPASRVEEPAEGVHVEHDERGVGGLGVARVVDGHVPAALRRQHREGGGGHRRR
mgnify:CR=1 FL=1